MRVNLNNNKTPNNMKNFLLLFSIFLSLNVFSQDNSGCTDPNAIQYDETATIDDGSCTVLICDEEYDFAYTGDTEVYFEKANNADWNDVANRDVITPTCEITRGDNQPLFNYVYQNSYYDNQDDCNIEWKQGSYDQPGTWYNGLSNAMEVN